MNSISRSGASQLASTASMATSRQAASTWQAATAPRADGGAQPSALLTLDSQAPNDIFYTRPKADTAAPVRLRAWASPRQDDITTLMARNGNQGAAGGLAAQWRGLGGALLSRFASAEPNYRQTLVDLAPVDGAATTEATTQAGAVDPQAFNALQNGAATVSLAIQTRSGQTMELKIAVNSGADDAHRGIHVEAASSGPLSDEEGKAVAALAEGFDQLLEGLGQPGKLKLDMAALMDYDSGVLASLDVKVDNPRKPDALSPQALTSFTLHLGDDRKVFTLQGAAGEISLSLDASMPLGPASAQQRHAAIDERLRQFDAAASRSHADGKLLSLFKEGFKQLHAAPARQTEAQAEVVGPVLARQMQPLQSGLADFEARFKGDSERKNDRGAVKEKGHTDYQVSQKTTVQRTRATGDLSITQTQSEQLDAHFIRSRFGGMLDTSKGDHDVHKIKDDNTRTALIETAKGQLTRALRQTEQHQLRTFDKLENHRNTEHRATPVDKRFVERLR